MATRIWHQSFTVLQNLPAYAAALDAHFKTVARADTEIVLHGMHRDTFLTNWRTLGIAHSRLGHYNEKPERGRVRELLKFYFGDLPS